MSNYNNSSLITSCVQSQPKIASSSSPNQRGSDESPKSRGQKPTNLRSPIAKRPPNAQVTLQGWLHKQGSDGLQLWRRRWFVLSELCLYYYKNTEEERLLGSVLLPSYHVSECQTSEKIRKFAFKLEHTNMRTYILAAESHKAMLQWICALNLACMPQIGSNPSNSDMKNLQQNVPFVPNHYGRQYPQPQASPDIFQPLYENAPPKPRRVSEPTRHDYAEYVNHEQVPQKYSHIIYANNEPNPRIYRSSAPPNSMHQLQNAERRTPDTYGRSNYDPRLKFPADYEDVYNIKNELYRPPNSPAAHKYIRNDIPPIVFRHAQYSNSYKPLNIEPTSRTTIYFPENYKPNREIISRPHSVDFLEHSNENDIQYKQPERPKSSLDINQRALSNENYFYSEQDYANKMRQSALYLQLHSTNANEYIRGRPQQGGSEGDMVKNRHGRFYDNQMRPPQQSQQAAPQQEVGMNNRISRTMPKMSSTSAAMNLGNMSPSSHPVSKSPQTLPNPRTNTGRESSDKKREESMKRLIEWKQRMLQSPLNYKQMSRRLNEQNKTKANASSDTGFSSTINCTIGLTNSATSSIASSQSQSYKANNFHSPAGQSNSYSSDDEASGSVSIVSGHDGQSVDYQWPMPLHSTYSSHQISQNDRAQFRGGNFPGVHSNQLTKKRQPVKPSDSCVESDRKDFKLSAGELLGRTHEELVLLLIQLRRESISTYQAIEACYSEIDSIKMLMTQSDTKQKSAHSQRLEYLKLQLLDLGKQYEKSKPLVNLVDNMVKLGSFYQQNHSQNDSRNRERIQFNQYVQERRLLAEERRDWEKLNLNQSQLQNKIQQLYELDNALRYESGTLADLRREKEYLEQALFNLQSRLNDPEMPSTPPAELDRVRRHQQLLERELSRVHVLLAYNSKQKLEETVAGNARIEQELLVLRQKLQERQRQKNNSFMANTLPKERKSLVENGEMEGELRRVQWLVGDLQKQRQELSVQVQNLTDKSHNLVQQLQWPLNNDQNKYDIDSSSYKSNCIQFPSNHLKRNQSSWLETDLDQCITNEYQKSPLSMPLINHQSDDSTSTVGVFSTDTSDTQQSNGTLHEKQEIKTVRIVKRESERRQRDRERTTGPGPGNALTLPVSSYRVPLATSPSTSSLKRDYEYTNDINYLYLNETNEEQISNQNFFPASKSIETLPTLKSNSIPLPSSVRRTIPKEKRRHHTAPDNTHISRELSLLATNGKENEHGLWKKGERRDRSLDDLDMERALRPRNNAPDVVRSTLGHKEVKYNAGTIDSVLGTPSKIIIPERYMPQDLPQLTAEEEQHRLRKVESIKKMLTDSTALNAFSDEKRQREHLLHLNQILAKQVIEMSKIVAGSKDKNSDVS